MVNIISGAMHFVASILHEPGHEEKISVILEGFRLNPINNITESDLQQILHYNLADPKQSFFIIGGMVSENEKKFTPEHIKACEQSDWYAFIRPNASSYIIFPSEHIGFQYNEKHQGVKFLSDGNMWGREGGTFQLDKNVGKIVTHSLVRSKCVLEMCEDFLKSYQKKSLILDFNGI